MKLINGYPEYILDSIKKVEKKREKNMSQPVAPLSLQDREKILSKYHPDYMKGTKRELKIGIDKGQLLYNGIVDLLESKPVLDPKDVDLSKIDYDVDLLIVGGGGAGINSNYIHASMAYNQHRIGEYGWGEEAPQLVSA